MGNYLEQDLLRVRSRFESWLLPFQVVCSWKSYTGVLYLFLLCKWASRRALCVGWFWGLSAGFADACQKVRHSKRTASVALRFTS